MIPTVPADHPIRHLDPATLAYVLESVRGVLVVEPDALLETAVGLITEMQNYSPPPVNQPVAEERTCAGCRGRRWVNDENWQPDYPKTWKGERYRGDGLIPCGSCNEGGWDVAVGQPVAEERT